MKLKNNSVIKKGYGFLKIVLTIFLLLILLVVIVQKFTKNNFAIGGVRVFNIVSESMKPKYEIGDILIIKKTDPSKIKIGDDITFKGSENELKGLVITHRVIEKREENGKYYFVTKGLANPISDTEISDIDVYGKVEYKTVLFSFLGRLMSNAIMYYILFILVGVGVSYQVVTAFFLNKEESEVEGNDRND